MAVPLWIPTQHKHNMLSQLPAIFDQLDVLVARMQTEKALLGCRGVRDQPVSVSTKQAEYQTRISWSVSHAQSWYQRNTKQNVMVAWPDEHI